MKIDICWPWELPRKLSGIAVVIDVNAATTNIAFLLHHQVKNLFIVNEKNVLLLKKKYPSSLVIGESLKLANSFFDCSNFPAEISKLKVTGKTILYMSNNGSKVIEKVFQLGIDTVITAGFVNLENVNQWLSKIKKQPLTLIPAGEQTFVDKKCQEDFLLAKVLKKILINKPVNLKEYLEKAKEFVRIHYDMKNMPDNLEIEFNLNSYSVVPKCYRNSEGSITVRG